MLTRQRVLPLRASFPVPSTRWAWHVDPQHVARQHTQGFILWCSSSKLARLHFLIIPPAPDTLQSTQADGTSAHAVRGQAKRSPIDVLREENQLLKRTIADAEQDSASLEAQLTQGPPGTRASAPAALPPATASHIAACTHSSFCLTHAAQAHGAHLARRRNERAPASCCDAIKHQKQLRTRHRISTQQCCTNASVPS